MNASDVSRRTDSATLQLNGKEIESTAATLVELLAEQGLDPAKPGIAVALNDSVIPRSTWTDCRINGGDRVEIITAMQGG